MEVHHHQIYYDRVLPYRRTDQKLQNHFVDIYVEAFNDPNGAYSEANTAESVLEEVWHHHIDHGRVSVAVDVESSLTVGLACVEMMSKASEEERQHAETVFEYLKTTGIRNMGIPTWYFSELAVLQDYRIREEHIGTELIRHALHDLRSRSHDGTFGHDYKMFILTRTDAEKSMSINAFKRAGFTFLDDVIQYAKDAEQVVKRGGKSINKVWGYTIVYPIGGF